MLDSKDFKISKLNSDGFGGKLELFTLKTNKSVSYVVKSEKRLQSINEFVAQNLLNSLGFYSLSAEIITYGLLGYGAIEYRPDIKRISITDTGKLTQIQKATLVELFLLNSILSNPDAGEYYITSDGDMCTLDYGEAIVTELILGIYLAGKPDLVNGMIKYNVDSAVSHTRAAFKIIKKYMLSDDFGETDIVHAAKTLLNRIKNLDITLLNNCFNQIDLAYFSGASKIYRNRIKDIIEMASKFEI